MRFLLRKTQKRAFVPEKHGQSSPRVFNLGELIRRYRISPGQRLRIPFLPPRRKSSDQSELGLKIIIAGGINKRTMENGCARWNRFDEQLENRRSAKVFNPNREHRSTFLSRIPPDYEKIKKRIELCTNRVLSRADRRWEKLNDNRRSGNTSIAFIIIINITLIPATLSRCGKHGHVRWPRSCLSRRKILFFPFLFQFSSRHARAQSVPFFLSFTGRD